MSFFNVYSCLRNATVDYQEFLQGIPQNLRIEVNFHSKLNSKMNFKQAYHGDEQQKPRNNIFFPRQNSLIFSRHPPPSQADKN